MSPKPKSWTHGGPKIRLKLNWWVRPSTAPPGKGSIGWTYDNSIKLKLIFGKPPFPPAEPPPQVAPG